MPLWHTWQASAKDVSAINANVTEPSAMTPIIIEDFLSNTQHTQIERALLSYNFPWFFYANTNADKAETQTGDVPQFVHGFIQDGRDLSEFSHIPHSIVQALGLEKTDILRAKANMLARDNAACVHPKHVDEPNAHLVMVYYVNDADGDTCLFKGAEISQRISPKRGRAVIFDGRTYHASSSPVAARFRTVVNINLRADILLDLFEPFKL